MDQEPCVQVAKFLYECMEYRRSEECEDSASLTLNYQCLERIGQVKSMTRFVLILEEFLRSHDLLLLRLVLVFLPMEPRWLRPGHFVLICYLSSTERRGEGWGITVTGIA
jgi:hypothetical protein